MKVLFTLRTELCSVERDVPQSLDMVLCLCIVEKTKDCLPVWFCFSSFGK